MKKTIYYATGNDGKLEQVKRFVEAKNKSLNIEQFAADISEIQTMDQKAIAISKALQAWDKLKKPLLVDDSGIYFAQYNSFPGTMTKFVFRSIGYEGIKKLVTNDNRAYFLVCLVYIFDENKFEVFEGKIDGAIKTPTGKPSHPHLPLNNIFYPTNSDKSYAQYYLESKYGEEKYNARIQAVSKFLDWYENQ